MSFLKAKIEQRFPEQYEQEGLFKALLELIDLNRNQRVAEGKTLAELATKAEGLSLQYLEFGLDYLYSNELSKWVKRDLQEKMQKKFYEQYQWPLLAGLICLVLTL